MVEAFERAFETIRKAGPIREEHMDHYSFLFMLQESGVTNMFGAVPYLVEHQGLDRREATEVLGTWMDNYAEIKAMMGR